MRNPIKVIPAAAMKDIWYENTSGLPIMINQSIIGPAMSVPARPQLRKYVALKIANSFPRFSGGINIETNESVTISCFHETFDNYLDDWLSTEYVHCNIDSNVSLIVESRTFGKLNENQDWDLYYHSIINDPYANHTIEYENWRSQL